MKQKQLYLNRNKTEPIQWEKKGRFLGVIFSENCTFNDHIKDVTTRAANRIKRMYRFKGYVKGEVLYKVYKTAIEPIMLYGTEVIYENLTEINLKKLLAIEYFAIKTSYGIKKQESISNCIKHIEKSVVTNINNRRKNFVRKNYDMEILRHTETTRYSGGRRIRVRKQHKSRGTKRNWKEKMHVHKEVLFMSDLSKENIEMKMEEQEVGSQMKEKKIRKKRKNTEKKVKIKVNIRRGTRELFEEGRRKKMIWVMEAEEVPWMEIEYEEQRREFKPG